MGKFKDVKAFKINPTPQLHTKNSNEKVSKRVKPMENSLELNKVFWMSKGLKIFHFFFFFFLFFCNYSFSADIFWIHLI